MRKTVLPTATVLTAMLAMLLALAAPTYSQTSEEDLAADEDGELVAPRPPDYQVDGNGFLIIGGDVRMPCSIVGKPPGPPQVRGTAEAAQAKMERVRKEQVRACEAAGFDTAADSPSGSSSASTTAGSATGGASANAADTALPDTGGPVLPVPLLLAAGASLAAGGLLTLHARR